MELYYGMLILMKFVSALIILLVWSPQSGAAVLFEENTVIEVQLTGPLHSVIGDGVQREELPFLMTVSGANIPVKVKMRGKSRARICKFPPLRLKFSGSDTQQSVFEGQKKLKLVTHCGKGKGGNVNVLEEYAAYRIFNLLSDYSFRVRLLHIRYEDTGQDSEANEQYGFVIEPRQQLQTRTEGEWVQLPGVKLSRLKDQQAALVYVFQYLIGNTDWSLVTAEGDDTCCHNIDLLEMDSELHLVPYDFDLSGLVNAAYAKPDASLRLKNVRQRRYRGYCMDKQSLTSAIRQIKSKRADILQVLEELPDSADKAEARSVKYVSRFFEMAENETKLIKSFEKSCLD
jgi:hypothetical protein